MANILPENETFTFEDREYINPQVSLDEQNAFIDNLRQTQQQNTGEIVQQTRNLGTEVPSNLGGLVGGEGYWTSRYQTPQTNALTSQLRATAQAQALNDVLANEQAMWKKRYQDAYRNYQKRSNAGGGGNGGDDGPDDGEVDFEASDKTVGSAEPAVAPMASGRYSYVRDGAIIPDNPIDIHSGSSVTGYDLTMGNVDFDVTIDNSGAVQSMTVNGKTYNGDEARSIWEGMKRSGKVSRIGD